MLTVRYERHLLTNPHLPFIFHTDTVFNKHSSYSHWHDNTEFLFCLEHSTDVYYDSEKLVMNKGDTIIINARSLHSFSGNNRARYHCLIIDNSFFTENGFDIASLQFTPKIRDEKAGELMEQIREKFQDTENPYRIVETKMAVSAYILHICKNYGFKRSDDSGGVLSKGHEAVLKAVEYIDNNYDKHMTIDEISAVAGFSKFHFSRLFKSYTGFTVIEHINGRRCENAKLLLEDSTKTISQISAECGFESCSYFAKAFQKNFGILPSAYRKSIE